MFSLGGYPLGAKYDPRAPWNEETRECGRCHGTGYIYHKYDPASPQEVEVSEEEYLSLPDQDPYDDSFVCKGEYDYCRECDGRGEIVIR